MAAGPIRLKGIDHLVLRVADVGAMMDFYIGVLGCTLEKEQPALGLHQLRAGAQRIDLVALDGRLGRMGGAGPGAEGRNLDHFCLAIAEFDEAALRQYLSVAGVEVGAVGERYGADGDGPSLYIRDPEGNTVELKGPATSA
ncbi:MAG: putative dioxygenase [Caulobacteraceae bacterium]|nr:putative dioxygenase [Caulobacteraceae bacterium]